MEDKEQDPFWVTVLVSLIVGIAAGAGLFFAMSGGI
jgi:hypothetical protein